MRVEKIQLSVCRARLDVITAGDELFTRLPEDCAAFGPLLELALKERGADGLELGECRVDDGQPRPARHAEQPCAESIGHRPPRGVARAERREHVLFELAVGERLAGLVDHGADLGRER